MADVDFIKVKSNENDYFIRFVSITTIRISTITCSAVSNSTFVIVVKVQMTRCEVSDRLCIVIVL